MAQQNEFSAWRIIRFIITALAAIAFFVCFLIWRTDNPRIEAFRFTIMDRYTPDIDWVYSPIMRINDLFSNFQSYEQLSRENRELRRQVQQMESWKEAALQLEQINAELRALNKLSQTQQMSFVSGEIIGDSGSAYSQTALVNIGRNKGITEGLAAVDSFGVIGRVIGVGEDKSRLLLLSDPSSQVSALIMPDRIRAVVRGNNTRNLDLILIEAGARPVAGSRVETSGMGVYPANLLLGNISIDTAGGPSVRIAADYSALEFARILLPNDPPTIPQSQNVVGDFSNALPAEEEEVVEGEEVQEETSEQ